MIYIYDIYIYIYSLDLCSPTSPSTCTDGYLPMDRYQPDFSPEAGDEPGELPTPTKAAHSARSTVTRRVVVTRRSSSHSMTRSRVRTPRARACARGRRRRRRPVTAHRRGPMTWVP